MVFSKRIKIILTTFCFLISFHLYGTCNVDTTNPIGKEEKNYLKRKRSSSRSALYTFLNQSYPPQTKLPTIGIATSGGGYRAMISSEGFLSGLELTRLLPAVTYASSLSGSTWLMGHFFARASFYPTDCPLRFSEFSSILKKNVTTVNFFNPKTLHRKEIINKLRNTSHIQPADIWGAILIDRLMSDLQANNIDIQNLSFENIRNLLERTVIYPFPLFSAAITNTWPDPWLEVDPYTSGGDYLMKNNSAKYQGAFIPTSALGSTFENGMSTTIFPEKSIGSLIGIFGSPYSLSIADILNFFAESTEKDTILTIVNWIIEGLHLYKKRTFPTNIPNFTLQMANATFQKEKFLTLSDAGEAFNLPFPPLLKRKVDIILVCDASTDACTPNHDEMKYAYQYAKTKGLKFPPITNPIKICNNLFLYQDQKDPNTPTILYFTNPIKKSTLHFDYTEKEFDQLCSFMKNLVVSSKKIIQKVITKKINSKNLNFNIDELYSPMKTLYVSGLDGLGSSWVNIEPEGIDSSWVYIS